MDAVAAVTTVTAPPPASSGTAGPAHGAPGPGLPSTVQAVPPAPAVSSAPGLSALSIENVLTAVQLELDNQPEEHPYAPNVIALEGTESALRQGLSLVLNGEAGIAASYLSGLLLSATV